MATIATTSNTLDSGSGSFHFKRLNLIVNGNAAVWVSPGMFPPTINTTPNSPKVWAKVEYSSAQYTGPRQRQFHHANGSPG